MVENKSKGRRRDGKNTQETDWLDTVISALLKLQKANSNNWNARIKAVESAIGPLKAACDRLYEYKAEHNSRNRHAAKCIEWLCSESDNGRKGYPALWDALACPEFIGELERWRDLEETGQTRTSREVEWNKNDADYISASEAVVTFTESKLPIYKLSKMLTPDGAIRYMRKKPRCRVHIGDFTTWAHKEYPADSVREQIADEVLADRAARQRDIDRHKLL